MKKIFLLLFVLGLLLPARQAVALLQIEISGGTAGATPIAIVPFKWQENGKETLPQDIAQIISQDLYRSGHFTPLTASAFKSFPYQYDQVRFQDWRDVGVENLIIGHLRKSGGGYIIHFQLFDVFRGVQLTGYSVRTSAKNLRKTAHQLSDIIYETLTGEPGAFATKLAYISATKSKSGKRQYALHVADADGYNSQVLLQTSEPLMSPAWSPDGSRIAYVSFERQRASIYIQHVASGKRQRVLSEKGMNNAPQWSPDGSKLAVVLSRSGNPDIYIYDVLSQELTQVTNNLAIDTEPFWSPDGKSIVFTSDRGGKPNIYQTFLNGRPALRLTFEGDYNARPILSPNGRYLAMVHGDAGNYRIAVMDMASGALRVLTQTKHDESPSFSPNGRMLVYATEKNNKSILAAVTIDGRIQQRVILNEQNVRGPTWSPYMP